MSTCRCDDSRYGSARFGGDTPPAGPRSQPVPVGQLVVGWVGTLTS
jgi:hypothetical protein